MSYQTISPISLKDVLVGLHGLEQKAWGSQSTYLKIAIKAIKKYMENDCNGDTIILTPICHQDYTDIPPN